MRNQYHLLTGLVVALVLASSAMADQTPIATRTFIVADGAILEGGKQGNRQGDPAAKPFPLSPGSICKTTSGKMGTIDRAQKCVADERQPTLGHPIPACSLNAHFDFDQNSCVPN